MIKRMFQLLNLLLATLAVFGCVQMFYEVIEYRLHLFDPVYTIGKPVGVAEAQVEKAGAFGYDMIVERDLFNTARATADKGLEPEVDLAAIKQTTLNLKLWGTVATADRKADLARAVIEERKSREQSLYRVGDAIANARISEIFRNGVVLDVNGRKEKLTLEEKVPGREITHAPEIITPTNPSLVAKTVRVESGRKISLPRSEVENALENINKLMNEVKIRPFYKKGETAGFIVANIDQESVLQELGLKSGDIVTRINGQQIKTPDDAMAFYERLKAGQTLSIEYMRRGRPQTIDYTVEDEMLGGN